MATAPSILFEPLQGGSITLPNRLVRSATAERLADPLSGQPLHALGEMYLALARGGVGTIITGHAYVAPSGKCHPEMSSLATDDVIRAWRATIRPAQTAGARLFIQINHGGSSCDPAITPLTLSPFGVRTNPQAPSRMLQEDEISDIITAFGQAARRARESGFDGVQIHAAHGYLISQFLTPRTNQRIDAWGGDAPRRRAFLLAVVAEVRRQVGTDYPVWLKLGVAGAPPEELTRDEGAEAAAASLKAGVDCIEISHALGPPLETSSDEPAFLELAQAVRTAVGRAAVLALVNGFYSRQGMETVLRSGLVQLVSLCRPLIAEPALARRLATDAEAHVFCVRCNRCWPNSPAQGIACKNNRVQEKNQC